MSKDSFKVIIAGGSVAGLSLGKMLEKVGIDFIILEAYHDIAPQAGASIGLLPNGLRILDQIGCYEDIKRLVPRPVDTVLAVQGSNGQTLVQFDDMETHAVERHGYPITFLDRQMLLEVLYRSIEDKSKILLNKRVVSVELLESGVKVLTRDGSTYAGDILVGADGVHSTVRSEMWRIANSIQPGYIPESESTAMPCDYSCVFGISSLIPNLDVQSGKMYRVWNNHYSYLIASGPQDRIYWFLFINLGETYHAPNIPRHTKEDEKRLIQEHLGDKITDNVTFGDIYQATRVSVMTALPEYVFQRWHFGRITTIGDAAHKFEPLSGQGGNAAIETAASLVNSIVEARKLHGPQPDDKAVNRLFEQVQLVRHSRVSKLVQGAHNQQRLEAMENKALKLIALHYVPLLSNEVPLSKLDNAVFPSIKLDMLPVPIQPRFLPYEDELYMEPKKREPLISVITELCFVFLAYYGYKMLAESRFPVLQNPSKYFVNRNSTDSQTLSSRRFIFLDIVSVERRLSVLVSRFIPAVSKIDIVQTLQCVYLLVSLTPIIAVWHIESHRKRNSGTLIALPLLWIFCAQNWSIGVVAPLYYLVSFYESRNPVYYRQISRAVPLLFARNILPGIILGYLIPTAMMFFQYRNLETNQNWIALWQLAPICPSIVAKYLPNLVGTSSDASFGRKAITSMYGNLDMPYLKQLYVVLFFVMSGLHVSTITACTISESLSLRRFFLPHSGDDNSDHLPPGIHNFFQYNLIIYAFSSLLWVIHSIWDLRRVGLSDVSYFKSASCLVVLFFVAGPGGMISAAQYWREEAMASMSKSVVKHTNQKRKLMELERQGVAGSIGECIQAL